MFKAVIFDLDGTLLNTIDDLADAGNYALAEQGFPTYPVERYKYFVGNGIPKLIERIVPAGSSKEIIEKTHSLFSSYYEVHMRDKTAPYAGITEMLDKLIEKNIKLGVVTNKAHEFAAEIVKSYFGSRFDKVFGERTGFPKKPDPINVNKMIEEWGLDKSEVLYAGDSNVDMETARNAEVKGCGVLWGFRTKEELIESGAVYLAKDADEFYRIVTGNTL